MSFKDMYYHDDMENLSEEIVFEEIHHLKESGDHDFPDSIIAIQDIAALALNRMPPKYICNFLEKKYPRESFIAEVKELRTYARRQILRALKKVRENPHD